MNQGEQNRSDGIAKLKDKHPEVMETLLAEIQFRTRDGQEVTADDIRHIPLPHPNCAGAAFLIARNKGLIELKTYKKALTPSCHARRLGVWVKKERQPERREEAA